MANKIKELVKNNPDLIRISSYALAIAGVILVIFMGYYLIATGNNDSYIDSASGERVYIQITGGMPVEGTEIVGMQAIQNEGLNVEAFKSARNKMMEFFSYAYPKVEKLSYKKDSVKVSDGVYSFLLTSNQGHKFNCEISGTTAQQYNVKISEGGSVILNYDSKAIKEPMKDISTLADKHLPHVFKVGGKDAILSYIRRTQKYEISFNNCGDETLKQEARQKVDEWLKDLNYNPSDLEIYIPNLCDGEF